MRQDGRGNIVSGNRTTCKRCGCDSVFWYQTQSGKWILYNGRGKPEVYFEGRRRVEVLRSQGNDFHKCGGGK